MDIDLNQIVTPAKSEISEFDIVSSINTYYKPEKLGDKINLEEFISKNESSVKKFEDGKIDNEQKNDHGFGTFAKNRENFFIEEHGFDIKKEFQQKLIFDNEPWQVFEEENVKNRFLEEKNENITFSQDSIVCSKMVHDYQEPNKVYEETSFKFTEDNNAISNTNQKFEDYNSRSLTVENTQDFGSTVLDKNKFTALKDQFNTHRVTNNSVNDDSDSIQKQYSLNPFRQIDLKFADNTVGKVQSQLQEIVTVKYPTSSKSDVNKQVIRTQSLAPNLIYNTFDNSDNNNAKKQEIQRYSFQHEPENNKKADTNLLKIDRQRNYSPNDTDKYSDLNFKHKPKEDNKYS